MNPPANLQLVPPRERDVSRAAGVLVDIGLRLVDRPRPQRCKPVRKRPEHAAPERRQPPDATAGPHRSDCSERTSARQRGRCHIEPGENSC